MRLECAFSFSSCCLVATTSREETTNEVVIFKNVYGTRLSFVNCNGKELERFVDLLSYPQKAIVSVFEEKSQNAE